MFARIMATDGGHHPPELWAQATAAQIFPIDDSIAPVRLTAAMRAQAAVADALVPFHRENMEEEQRGLVQDANGHLATPPDPTPYVESAFAAVKAALASSLWPDHAERNREGIMGTLYSHFGTAKEGERSWWTWDTPEAHQRRAAIIARGSELLSRLRDRLEGKV